VLPNIGETGVANPIAATVDGGRNPEKSGVNNRINYQPQLVKTGFQP